MSHTRLVVGASLNEMDDGLSACFPDFRAVCVVTSKTTVAVLYVLYIAKERTDSLDVVVALPIGCCCPLSVVPWMMRLSANNDGSDHLWCGLWRSNPVPEAHC